MAASLVHLRVGLGQRFVVSLRPSTLALSKRNFASAPQIIRTVRRRHAQHGLPWILTATGVALGVSSLTSSPPVLHCDDMSPAKASPSLPPPPKSSVNAYELVFGTACGVCAGVFVKKSARMVAFFLGGLFVVLQYLGSLSLVKVDWARMGSRFEDLFYTTDALGNKRPPTVRSMWRWIVNFLMADFQPRASFVAGLALGLRIG